MLDKINVNIISEKSKIRRLSQQKPTNIYYNLFYCFYNLLYSILLEKKANMKKISRRKKRKSYIILK